MTALLGGWNLMALTTFCNCWTLPCRISGQGRRGLDAPCSGYVSGGTVRIEVQNAVQTWHTVVLFQYIAIIAIA